MSACNVWALGDVAHLMTDGAAYRHDDGRLGSIESKVFELPQSRSAFARRGSAAPICEELTERLSGVGHFDDVIAIAGAHAFEAHRDLAQRFTDLLGRDPHFEITLIGWSDIRSRPEVWQFWTDPAHPEGDPWPGFAPFVPIEQTGILIQPGIGPTDEFNALFGLSGEPDIPTLAAIDVECAAISIMERQRALMLDLMPGGSQQGCVVGGFIELTTATRAGISRKILKRWPDEIGRPMTETRSRPAHSLAMT